MGYGKELFTPVITVRTLESFDKPVTLGVPVEMTPSVELLATRSTLEEHISSHVHLLDM